MAEGDLRRRLAAILAADAAGYSRLMGHDEQATVAALDDARHLFRTAIEANQGRVIDMAGDSVLAVFETAAGAVDTALTVQQAMHTENRRLPEDRRMHFRIGIHLGDVIEKPDGTIYGNGVNIAARLQALAEPGGTMVSDLVHSTVQDIVAASYEEAGEHIVKNIARPVLAYRVGRSADNSSLEGHSPPIDLSLPDKPSVAVLAFTNMSGDPEQEYFTDGITEDIITELARFDSLFVISRNSSFTYKGQAVDVKRVGRELGVRYVVEGSIRRAASRVRVTAQLIDSVTGNHVWAERYDREVADIFAVQEEVTECIVAAIAPQIDAVEAVRTRKRPGNLSAYELAVRAAAMLFDAYKNSDRPLHVKGLGLARAALEIDPDSTMALHAVALAQFHNVALRTVPDRQAAWQEGIDAADRALAIAASGAGHTVKACLLSHAPTGGRWEEAKVEAEAAFRLNPQDTTVIGVYAMTLSHTGAAAKAVEVLRRSLRINPRNPFAYDSYFELAQAHTMMKEYSQALEWAMRARAAAPRSPLSHILIAVIEVGLGDLDKARISLNTARQLAPELVAKRLQSGSFAHQEEFRRRYDAFLRVAADLDSPQAAEAFR